MPAVVKSVGLVCHQGIQLTQLCQMYALLLQDPQHFQTGSGPY